MAGGLLPIIFDTKSSRLVFSETDSSGVILPDLYQEDGVYIAFQAVKQINRTQLPFFEKIPLSGYALRISVGVAGNPYAQATPGDFVLSSDGYVYNGNLNLNTAEVDAAFSSATFFDTTLEIFLSSGSTVHRGQFSVKIRKAIHTTGALVPVATDRALGAQEADRTYVRKEAAAGDYEVKTTPSGRRFAFYAHDDGTFRGEEIT